MFRKPIIRVLIILLVIGVVVFTGWTVLEKFQEGKTKDKVEVEVEEIWDVYKDKDGILYTYVLRSTPEYSKWIETHKPWLDRVDFVGTESGRHWNKENWTFYKNKNWTIPDVFRAVLNFPPVLDELRIELGLTDVQYRELKNLILKKQAIENAAITRQKVKEILNQKYELFIEWIREALLIYELREGIRIYPGKSIEEIFLLESEPSVNLILSILQEKIENLGDKQIAEITDVLRNYKKKMLVLREKLYRGVEYYPSSMKETYEEMINRRKKNREELIQTKHNMEDKIRKILPEEQRKNFDLMIAKELSPKQDKYEWEEDLNLMWFSQ